MRSQSGPRFRPAILALSGPLIPRVVFVLEGWTSASLNLSLLCPCLALPCLALSSPVCMSRPFAHSRPRPRHRYQCAVPDPLPRGNHDTVEARYPRRRVCTSDSGGFINGDVILGRAQGLDLLGPNLGIRTMARPCQPSCPISF